MEGQLSISTFMGFFNEEEYEIKTINDYDYDDYRGNVYLDDFDNEEEYKKFLKEIDEEYEKDSYEAYVWNKNVLYYNKNISKNELDNEIDILVSEEEKLIKILLDKLIVIKKNEQNKDSIKEMMSYYNFKYKIENEFYEKVYNKLDLKYREFIKEKSIYKFNILKRQNDFCSPLYYYSDLFKI